MSDSIPTHRRTIVIESFDEGDTFVLRAQLRDERPWAEGAASVHDVHDLTLELTVDRRGFLVTDARATMDRTPHIECAAIEPAVRDLIGLSVTRGFNKAVQDRLGRQRGCTHLEFLARAIGPAVIQTLASASSRRAGNEGIGRTVTQDSDGWLRNTCHLWADGGIGQAKIAEGWRPGTDGYPAPTLVALRARRAASTE